MSNDVTKTVVTKNPDRFELRVDGDLVGFADYAVHGERMVFTTPRSTRPRGDAGTAVCWSMLPWMTSGRTGSRPSPRAPSSMTTSTGTRSTPTGANATGT